MSRIAQRFSELQQANRAAFIPFITAGDPDTDTSFGVLRGLPEAGAGLIELGVPFSDPMADGPAIQASSLRALNAGMTLEGVLALVRRFRTADETTPVVLMGYFNPIHAYGVERFVRAAGDAGVDGLITVDLPPEEEIVLRGPATARGVDLIRLATPTSDCARLARILDGASGFVYYVSVAGVTGTRSFAEPELRRAVLELKQATSLPVAIGFGVRTPAQARGVARFADGVVVGSAIVQQLESNRTEPCSSDRVVERTLDFCRSLADAVHAARENALPG